MDAKPSLTARSPLRAACLAAMIGAFAACEGTARLPVSAGIGAAPALPPPDRGLFPAVEIAEAKGWPSGTKPVAVPGTVVSAFATGLDHPRWLYVLPNGDVLVAETNAPPNRDNRPGIKGWFFKYFQKKAGGAVPSANRITLLRDADGDGIAETQSAFLDSLNSPFGMTLVGSDFYVANTDAVVRFPYVVGEIQIDAPGTRVVALPAGRINHHWTKGLVASPDGSKLYVSVGSNSNVGDEASRTRKDGRRSGRSTRSRGATGFLRRDCAIRSASRGNPKPARCG